VTDDRLPKVAFKPLPHITDVDNVGR